MADVEQTLQTFFGTPVSDFLFFEKPVTCSEDLTLFQMAEILAEKNIGALIVVDSAQRPIGVMTERDMMRKVLPKGVDLKQATVGQFMTKKPICIRPGTPLHQIMAAMRLGKFRHLIVVDAEGILTGVLSMKDVFYHLDTFFRDFMK